MKILILKPSSLGDVVQALPVLRALKRHWPHSEIHWWIESRLAPLLDGDPDLTGIVRFERNGWGSFDRWFEVVRSIRWMRQQSFDLVIDLQSLARSGAFAWLANGKLLVGLDEPREGARGFYDIAVRRQSFHMHAVDWYLAVLHALHVPVNWDFEWLPMRPQVAVRTRATAPVGSFRWIAVQPGARWLNKRWPVEFYAELIRKLAAATEDVRFVILGSDADRDLGATITAGASDRCLDLTGQLSLPEMVEWIRMTELMVSNDTGPMHVAAALRKPIVALFGPTEPQRTGPYAQLGGVIQLQLPCVPCMSSVCTYLKPMECLRAISAEHVAHRVRQVLNGAFKVLAE